jgi:hypothetical protein
MATATVILKNWEYRCQTKKISQDEKEEQIRKMYSSR